MRCFIYNTAMFAVSWWFIIQECLPAVAYQGVAAVTSILIPSLILRLVVLTHLLHEWHANLLGTLSGAAVLIHYYEGSSVYFFILCIICYLLLSVVEYKGVTVAVLSVAFIIACEWFVVDPTSWHKIRGSILLMIMKMVSVGFDMEASSAIVHPRKKPANQQPATATVSPTFLQYTCYCIMPGTTIFGPFISYQTHLGFLNPTPLTFSWLLKIVASLFKAVASVCVSVCIATFLFPTPYWNKWMSAYSAALSFRTSHYFVCYLSEVSATAAGIGHERREDGTYEWGSLSVCHPSHVEFPRSFSMIVTNWNLSMHLFLKNYVFKPARGRFGPFGAILLTFMASSILHGLNFQLAAVILSVGVYAYIENRLRTKLSQRLDACIMDRPCAPGCNHSNTSSNTRWVWLVNLMFTFLVMFHLAYLGLMFKSEPNMDEFDYQGFSMWHTLRKWAQLDFASHWVALATYLITLVL